ncbi:hypothetical protein BM221_005333 [Beauveria bassiana]|uniref:Uncharacterized protein n=1 Tax=Beauveria bassiana TaxID=176275 RepID=A0A2N6NN96_BEABA|nr:hypothetical protein BM221_005333 [Beauveria bassiana]
MVLRGASVSSGRRAQGVASRGSKDQVWDDGVSLDIIVPANVDDEVMLNVDARRRRRTGHANGGAASWQGRANAKGEI